MIENILTNYNIKFINSQLDHDYISKSKFYYNIYNNKISEPLQKFWFSVPNIKYSNNYSNFKILRFLMNNKNENIIGLINYIKDIGNYLIDKLSPTFENITLDYPWKESTQYPYIFTLFTNTDTLFIDSSGNNIDYNLLTYNDSTYSIIFEISSIRIIPIKIETIETHTIKINLVLILMKQNEKKDLKKYLFANNYNENIETNLNQLSNHNFNSTIKKLPFLNDISNDFLLNKTNKDSISNNKQSSQIHTSNKLIINTEQILKVINGLKKVEIKKEICEDFNNNNNDNSNNNLQINNEYIEKKNSLKKVKTDEKSLLNNLQKKKKKKIKKEKIDIDNKLEKVL